MSYDKGSVIAVLEAVTRYGEISRAELSEITGFSRVTVGKAVEALESIGMVEQYKKDRGSAGRKAELCRLNSGCGMLLFDLSGEFPHIKIYDASLRSVKEYKSESCDLSEAFITGFGAFCEIFGDGLMGIGCVIPDGKREEYLASIENSLGHIPELIIDESHAYAIANSQRFDYNGTALIIRLAENGGVSGTVMHGAIPYIGAHGLAGRFGRLANGKDALLHKLAELSLIIDPALIHIACENEADTYGTVIKLKENIIAMSQNSDGLPDLIAEHSEFCAQALDGAAMFLRERAVLSKLTNNS